MRKGRLYLIVSLASLAGLAWVVFNAVSSGAGGVPDLCPFKNVTGLPCPSCGSTHSVLKILHLDWRGALYDNPIGFVVAAALALLPAWLLYDLFWRRTSFYTFYVKAETIIRKPWIAATLILLVTANWIWNIYKYAL